jgi:hypothetical protein
MTSFEKKELVHLEGDEKYTDIYTNNSKFSIEENGDVGFATGTFKDGTSEYHKLKDIAGKWNTKQYDTELLVLQNDDFSFKTAQQGKDFPRDNIKNKYNSRLKQSGPKGIRVMSKTDISGEDQYENLPDDLSFEALWQTGGLLPKFYENFKAKDGVKWMDDPDNASMLADMLSEYLTDVNHYTHRQNFKAKKEDAEGGKSGSRRETIRVNYGVGYITTKSADLFFNDIKNKELEIIDPRGNNYKWNEDKNTYELLSKNKNGKIIKTPITNKKMLQKAELWQADARYRMDNYEMVELEEDVQNKLQRGVKTTASEVEAMSLPGRKS